MVASAQLHDLSNPIKWLLFELQQDRLYLLLVPYILLMRPTRAFVKKTSLYENNKATWKTIMGAYNLIMSAFSLCCSACILCCVVFTVPDGVYSATHFSERTGIYSLVAYLFYLSKYVEFLDTYFLILCNRYVSWLQFIHHVGAVVDMGCLVHAGNDGIWIFVGLNGLIHTVMYYYYACCIMKWEFKLMPKSWITRMQLVQFFTGFTVYYNYGNVPGFWNDYRKRYGYYFTYVYVWILVVLFLHFYVQTYMLKQKCGDDAANGKKICKTNGKNGMNGHGADLHGQENGSEHDTTASESNGHGAKGKSGMKAE